MNCSCKPWSDFELQVLYDHVNEPDWVRKMAATLTWRSAASIRSKMAKLLEETGVVPKYARSPATRKSEIAAQSDKLRDRILEAA